MRLPLHFTLDPTIIIMSPYYLLIKERVCREGLPLGIELGSNSPWLTTHQLQAALKARRTVALPPVHGRLSSSRTFEGYTFPQSSSPILVPFSL